MSVRGEPRSDVGVGVSGGCDDEGGGDDSDSGSQKCRCR